MTTACIIITKKPKKKKGENELKSFKKEKKPKGNFKLVKAQNTKLQRAEGKAIQSKVGDTTSPEEEA